MQHLFALYSRQLYHLKYAFNNAFKHAFKDATYISIDLASSVAISWIDVQNAFNNATHCCIHRRCSNMHSNKKGKCRTNALAADKCNSTISMASLIEMHQQRLHKCVLRCVACLGTTVSNNRIQVIAPKVSQEMLKRFLCLPKCLCKVVGYTICATAFSASKMRCNNTSLLATQV